MNEHYPRKGLFDTEERTICCSTVGRDYHLSVALPESYATSDQAYPVIYLLGIICKISGRLKQRPCRYEGLGG